MSQVFTSARNASCPRDTPLALSRTMDAALEAARDGVAIVALSRQDMAVLPALALPHLRPVVELLRSGSNAAVRYEDLVPEAEEVVLGPADLTGDVSESMVWNKRLTKIQDHRQVIHPPGRTWRCTCAVPL